MAKILLVEDHRITQRILTHTLTKHQHTCVLANNGVEALEKVAAQDFDLALVDIAMPLMDGITFLRELRSGAFQSNLPVIMLSASGQEGDKVVAQELGVKMFLSKPVSTWELSSNVERVLNG
jgi:DNA-binding response OmpR family regulator